MGAVLELPPAAAPFTAEARSGSFYLGSGAPGAPPLFTAHLAEPWTVTMDLTDMSRGYPFSVSGEHVPALLAALRVVARRPEARRAIRPRENPWRVSPAGAGGLRFEGPVWLYGITETAADDVPVSTIEINYSDLWSLQVSAGDSPPIDG